MCTRIYVDRPYKTIASRPTQNGYCIPPTSWVVPRALHLLISRALIRSTGTNYHVIASVASAHVRPIRRQSEVNSTSNDSTNQGTNTVQSIHPQDAVADNGIPPCPWSICKGRVPLPWP